MSTASGVASLLDTVVKEGGSDLHISAGSHPIIRVAGALVPLVHHDKLTPADTERLLKELLGTERWERFLTAQSIDFAYAHTDGSRFRVNGYIVGGACTVAMRLIPKEIRTFASLNLPPVLEVFSQRQQGFFLVVGPVGQGKSTTLAALVDRINETRDGIVKANEPEPEFVADPYKEFRHSKHEVL